MLFIKKIENLVNRRFHSISHDDQLRIEYTISSNNFLRQIVENESDILYHSIGVAKMAEDLAYKYTANIEIDNKENIIEISILAGFFHDLGKVLPKEFTIHDSLNIELLLRTNGLYNIAQAVRHNPYLFLFDLRNGNLTIPQLVVTQADTMIDKCGKYINRETRLENIIQRKKINAEFQKAYWELIDAIYHSNSIRLAKSKLKVAFVERCDGRYRIENTPNYLNNLSSYSLSQELIKMGYNVSIYGDMANEFNIDEIKFIPTGNSLIQVYNQVRKNDFVYITGWTSLLEYLIKNNNTLPIIVFRSLKQTSLSRRRLNRIIKYQNKVILVSNASAKYLDMLVNKFHIKNSAKFNPTIIPNGINKNIFHYRKKEIKKQFVYVGALVKEKGILEVIEIARKFPELKCILVGESKMYGNARRNDLKTIDLPKNIELAGQLKQDEISELYRTSLFSLFLTDKNLIFETFGKSSIESQLCGCPVIYNKNGGLQEFAVKSSPNKGFNRNNIRNICKYIDENYKQFTNIKAREQIAEIADSTIMSWSNIAPLYILKSYESLMTSLQEKLLEKKSIKKYLLSS